MTREEAIAILRNQHRWTGEPEKINEVRAENEALYMAINALEQEPCEDCITLRFKKGTLKYSDKDYVVYKKEWLKKWWQPELALLGIELSSIQPKPKTGHWILADEQNKEDVENDNYRFICSECQCSDIHAKGTIVPYCWNCGAKMIEPQNLKYADNDTMMPAT